MILPTKRTTTRICVALFGLAILALVFLSSATAPRDRRVEVGMTPARPLNESRSAIKIMAYNINGCQEQRSCLDETAALILSERPEIVLLSHVLFECGRCEPSNQVEYLAWTANVHAYVFSENYRAGWPALRNNERVGNAILSQFPLRNARAQPLSKPRFRPRRNRRALWAEVDIDGRSLLVAALHNTSINPPRNLRQLREVLSVAPGPVILGGDFNAQPDSSAIRLILDSGKFTGDIDGGATFPSDAPRLRVDYIFAPSDWQLLEHRTIDFDRSDHLPVVSTFAVPQAQASATYE